VLGKGGLTTNNNQALTVAAKQVLAGNNSNGMVGQNTNIFFCGRGDSHLVSSEWFSTLTRCGFISAISAKAFIPSVLVRLAFIPPMDGPTHKLLHDQIAIKTCVASFVHPCAQPFEFVHSGKT
jgi:hypothetical protein